MVFGEAAKWLAGDKTGTYYKTLLQDATEKPVTDLARRKVIKSHELPWENSPHGLLKHLVNEDINTRAETVDAYMQIIPAGSKSGRHRQLAEQAFYVVEGNGYDIHIDCDLKIPGGGKYLWVPQEEEKKFDWEAGDLSISHRTQSVSILMLAQTTQHVSL